MNRDPTDTILKRYGFTKYRNNVLEGTLEDAGWAEWSVEEESDVRDVTYGIKLIQVRDKVD